MTPPLPEDSHAEGAIFAPAPSANRATRSDLVLGVVIGAAVSVAVLLPGLISAFGGGDVLPALTESGSTVVLGLLAIVIVIWAAVDGIPAWRSRGPRVPAEVAP
jgi:hypothetical protein